MNFKFLAVISLLFFKSSLFATDSRLDAISLSEFESISKELQANFTHTAVSSAGVEGNIFGFDLGIIAGATKSKELEKLAKELDPDAGFGLIPHAALMATVSVPLGFSGEATFTPKVELSGLTYKSNSFALKWTFSKVLGGFFDNSIRLHYSKNDLSYEQVIQNAGTGNNPINSNISFSNTVTGLSYLIGKSLKVIEPWVGIGYVKGKTDVDIKASGNATIFDQTVAESSRQGLSKTNRGIHLFAGLNVNLLVLRAGLEVSNLFGVNKVTAKTTIFF